MPQRPNNPSPKPADARPFNKSCGTKAAFQQELGVYERLGRSDLVPEVLSSEPNTRTIVLQNVGSSLYDLIVTQQRPMTIDEIGTVFARAARCLQHLHTKGVVHYDINLSNICVKPDLRLCLVDFGLAFPIDRPPPEYTKQRVGTPSCMSPEHLNLRPDLGKQADIFCLAVTMLQLIQGGLPVVNLSEKNVMSQLIILCESIPSKTHWNDSLPQDLSLLLCAMLNPQPSCRPTVESICRMLERYLSQASDTA